VAGVCQHRDETASNAGDGPAGRARKSDGGTRGLSRRARLRGSTAASVADPRGRSAGPTTGVQTGVDREDFLCCRCDGKRVPGGDPTDDIDEETVRALAEELGTVEDESDLPRGYDREDAESIALFEAVAAVARRPGLVAVAGLPGLVVGGLTAAGASGAVGLSVPVLLFGYLAWALATAAGYGVASAALLGRERLRSGLEATARRVPVGAALTALSGLTFALGLGVVAWVGQNPLVLAGLLAGVALVGALPLNALQFADARVVLGGASAGEALVWNVTGALDAVGGVVYAATRFALLGAWLWFPLNWTTATTPSTVELAAYVVASVLLAAVLVVWHVLAYEGARGNVRDRPVGSRVD
jgi:hypothetical protein